MDDLPCKAIATEGPTIFFDPRWHGQHGIGRFAAEVTARLPRARPLGIYGRKLAPIDPLMITAALAGKRRGIYFSPGFNPPLRSPIPIAFTIHDLIHLDVPEESSTLRRLYYRYVVAPATRRAHSIFTVSDFSKARILDWSGIPAERVEVVGNGISSSFHPEGARYSPGFTYFLHVGRRVAHKNINRLLEGFRNSRAYGVHLLLFTGHADAATAACVARLGMESTVRFTGNLDDDALATVYRGAEALLFPSLYEGFGLPIIEAMACGTPVLTSNLTAMREVASSASAILVDPYRTDAIENGIDVLTENGQVRQNLITQGLLQSARFTWKETAKRISRRLLAT